MLLCHSHCFTHMAIELWPEVLAIVVPSECSPLVGSGISKHIKGSKERYLLGQKHNMLILGVMPFIKLQNDTSIFGWAMSIVLPARTEECWHAPTPLPPPAPFCFLSVRRKCWKNDHAHILPSTEHENNIAQPLEKQINGPLHQLSHSFHWSFYWIKFHRLKLLFTCRFAAKGDYGLRKFAC